MLDNGAFSRWMAGARGPQDWTGYYEWVERWSDYRTMWAVIPDVIDGDLSANMDLIQQWPHGSRVGAPVWHMHEPISHLLWMAERWPRICIGSSGEYRAVGSASWRRRMDTAFNRLCDAAGRVPCDIHMLRGMALSGDCYPFTSLDSTNIARNHQRDGDPALLAARLDAIQCPPVYLRQPFQQELLVRRRSTMP